VTILTIVVLIFFNLASLEFVKVDNQFIFYNDMRNFSFPIQANSLKFEKYLVYFVCLKKCKLKQDINKLYKFYKAYLFS